MRIVGPKEIRLKKAMRILASHPEGLTRAELARKLGVNRSTITRYLENCPIPVMVRGKLIKIAPTAELMELKLTIHEAMSLHLACRLLAQRLDRAYSPAASMVEKLVRTMEEWGSPLTAAVQYAAQSLRGKNKNRDKHFEKTLDTLAEAWIERCQVRVLYESRSLGQQVKFTLSPLTLEPYPIGMSIQLLGALEPEGSYRVFRVDRIVQIRKLDSMARGVSVREIQRILNESWGLWIGEGEPEMVRLRFSAALAKRVRETRWHPREQTRDLKDGGLEWACPVVGPLEMLSWILGWGSGCEVLEPVSLRKMVQAEVSRWQKVYG